jgi:aminoglycoside phosphotransferase (APT) family kinase protein
MRDAALARLRELPQGDRLLHGDLHPGNVMMQDGEPVILDWSNAARGNPEADLTRTLMMIRLGEPPPGTSLLLRALAKVGRRLFLGSYRRAYRRVRYPDEALMRAWELPVAVARLSEGIKAERPALEKFIERRIREG